MPELTITTLLASQNSVTLYCSHLLTGDICWEKRERIHIGQLAYFPSWWAFPIYQTLLAEKLMIIRCQQIGQWQTKTQRHAIFLPSPFLANLFCPSPSLLSTFLSHCKETVVKKWFSSLGTPHPSRPYLWAKSEVIPDTSLQAAWSQVSKITMG